MPDLSERPVLDPSIPFTVHTADGGPLDVGLDGHDRPGAAFRLADAQLPGYVVLTSARSTASGLSRSLGRVIGPAPDR
jgi:hypothetical protein